MVSYVSEQASPVMPMAMLFQFADLVAGVLFMLVGYTVVLSGPPVEAVPSPIITMTNSQLPLNRREWRLNAQIHVLFVILGVATIVDSVFPMECPESLLPSPLVESHLCRTTNTIVHEISSVIASAAGIAACILAIVLVYRRRLAQTLHLSILGSVFIILTLYTGIESFIHLPYKGLAQRIALAAFALWFVFYIGTIATLNRGEKRL